MHGTHEITKKKKRRDLDHNGCLPSLQRVLDDGSPDTFDLDSLL